MEVWRIACPICGAALEDFRLYTRLFRADPADALLARIGGGARDGERIMDRASKRRGGGAAHAALMRSLLLPQVALRGTRETAAAVPRLLHLVVPGSGDFFERLSPEAWPGGSRILPLSVRIPVLAGVAAVSSRPDHWVTKLLAAAGPAHQARLLYAARALTSCSDDPLPAPWRAQ